MAYTIKKPARTLADQVYVVEAAKGLGVTFKRLFTNVFGRPENKKIATIRYPDEVRDYPERFRGVHRLTHRSDGSPRCVACLCCSTACPAQCIYIEPAEYEELSRNPLGEKADCTPAIPEGRIYLRSVKHLYCIGKSDS